MKITLISPKGPLYRHRGGIFKKNLRYAPLTLTTLAAYVPPELNATVEIFDEGIEDVDLNLQTNLIGMTVITGNAVRAYELADHFRSRGIPVILGGPHITLVPDDAQPHADSVVVGYAEDTWPQLLRDFAAEQLQPRYVQAPDLSLANRPFPKRTMMKKQHYITTQVFEATRSCIHTCEFCVAPTAWGIRPYFKPVEDVVADIKQHWGKRIIFVDLNLISDKEYAARLFEAMIPLKVNWFGLTTTLLGDDEALLKLAARSGCTGLLMGFETISPANLRLTRKGFNSPSEYKQLTQKLHAHGITLMACFTFGLDHDTPEVFMQTAKFAIDAGIDLPRFAIVTPFPNTGLYKRLDEEGRILTKNWELYDAQHVVFQPKLMTPAELYAGHEKAWKYTYTASAMATRYLKSRIQTPVWWVANMGYRFYAHHLKDFYNCDWIIGQRDEAAINPVLEPAMEMAVPATGKPDNAPCG
ncbi:MAG: B12-binding domain-containing radical SAM protein [Chloroflexi bacterium HGW-Chloroflexi-6]|nr:MAG: B12-binding domain-containing radical SAM protein [Chloroflexi bacterium HGW-Chloroflexi-6]